jgi:hypothetical protein
MNGFAAFLTAAHQRRNPEAIPHRTPADDAATERPRADLAQLARHQATRRTVQAHAEGSRLGRVYVDLCAGDAAAIAAMRATHIAAMDEAIARGLSRDVAQEVREAGI